MELIYIEILQANSVINISSYILNNQDTHLPYLDQFIALFGK